MKFDVSGVPKPPKDRRPGSLLGERRVACFRCGDERAESELTTVPPGAPSGTSRIFVCAACA